MDNNFIDINISETYVSSNKAGFPCNRVPRGCAQQNFRPYTALPTLHPLSVPYFYEKKTMKIRTELFSRTTKEFFITKSTN
jgi:hypothetical protein